MERNSNAWILPLQLRKGLKSSIGVKTAIAESDKAERKEEKEKKEESPREESPSRAKPRNRIYLSAGGTFVRILGLQEPHTEATSASKLD